jgi:invasion protein IalB
MKRLLVYASLLSFMVSAGPAFAQAPEIPAAKSKADKQAISKTCSDQANAKGLHGKARKKFRSECKRTGGKAM